MCLLRHCAGRKGNRMLEDRHSGGGWVGKEGLQEILELLGAATPLQYSGQALHCLGAPSFTGGEA